MVEFNKVFLNKKVRHKITGNIGYIKSCQPNHSENYYFGVYWEFFNNKTTNYYWNDIFHLEFIDDE